MKYFAAVAAGVVLGAASPALAFVNVGAITASQSRYVESEREQERVRVCGGHESLHDTSTTTIAGGVWTAQSVVAHITVGPWWEIDGHAAAACYKEKKWTTRLGWGICFCLKRGTPISHSRPHSQAI